MDNQNEQMKMNQTDAENAARFAAEQKHKLQFDPGFAARMGDYAAASRAGLGGHGIPLGLGLKGEMSTPESIQKLLDLTERAQKMNDARLQRDEENRKVQAAEREAKLAAKKARTPEEKLGVANIEKRRYNIERDVNRIARRAQDSVSTDDETQALITIQHFLSLVDSPINGEELLDAQIEFTSTGKATVSERVEVQPESLGDSFTLLDVVHSLDEREQFVDITYSLTLHADEKVWQVRVEKVL